MDSASPPVVEAARTAAVATLRALAERLEQASPDGLALALLALSTGLDDLERTAARNLHPR
jgi:hypothetical protein